MAKIEVVIDGDRVPAVRDLLIDAGGTGYTGVSGTSGVSGLGHRGHHRPPAFNDRASLSMLITVVPQDKVPSLVTGLRRLLEGRHGIFFVTQIRVSAPTTSAERPSGTRRP